ncbi:hypothetical protein B296_00039469 [Ensete ventricosum]|uniref:Uncharacterized protein n=1 Tax=Ensete ventricosum TaxID=4639 RepID=A0A426Y075_ENSVE|nr:hypothetical protein B296_00039469 [Ensete ventricosum]
MSHLAIVADSFVVVAAAAVFATVVVIASLHRRHYNHWSSPPSLLFGAIAAAVAPLALGQVSSSPRFYYSPLPLPLSLQLLSVSSFRSQSAPCLVSTVNSILLTYC